MGEERTLQTDWNVKKTNTKTNNIDLAYLNDMAGGDTDFVVEVIEMFMAAAPEGVKQILNHNKLGSYDKVRAAVHKLKPTIQMLGDMELHQLAVTIEEQCTEVECMDEAEKQLLSDKAITFCKSTQSLLKALEQVVAELRGNAA